MANCLHSLKTLFVVEGRVKIARYLQMSSSRFSLFCTNLLVPPVPGEKGFPPWNDSLQFWFSWGTFGVEVVRNVIFPTTELKTICLKTIIWSNYRTVYCRKWHKSKKHFRTFLIISGTASSLGSLKWRLRLTKEMITVIITSDVAYMR